MDKKLCQLIPAFNPQLTQADGFSLISQAEAKTVQDISVSDLAFDSRQVTPGSLFFALPGTHIHGNEFIPAAIEKGANVIVFQDEFSKDLQIKIAKAVAKRSLEQAFSAELTQQKKSSEFPVFCKVPDTRICMAPVSASFYDNPSQKLAVIAVTGTEGKSSTVSFIWQLLRLCGKKAGFISTVQYSLGDEAVNNPQHQTTPEAPVIQRNLFEMLKNGCEYAVIETSSHGLSEKLNRTGCILFDCAVFMNVTLEHLEFHKTFEQYRNDKANLFRKLDTHNHEKIINGKKVRIFSSGIVNLEDASARYFINSTRQQVFGFTTNGQAGKTSAQLPELPANLPFLKAQNIVSTQASLEFDINSSCLQDSSTQEKLTGITKPVHISAKLPGAFNAYNLMAAMLAVSNTAGIQFEELAQKTAELLPVTGRMTVIDQGQPFEVIVDYAHTPSSFETIFPPVRKRCTGKMMAVFGSGGDRDLTKRPLQGKIAAEFCDIIILADEDPRGEDPVALLQMIADGAVQNGKTPGKNLFITHERGKAIRQAFAMAQKGDIVLLLGKSHENSIIYRDFSMPYDEISEAKTALNEMGFEKKA